jgi:hypothetical protein
MSCGCIVVVWRLCSSSLLLLLVINCFFHFFMSSTVSERNRPLLVAIIQYRGIYDIKYGMGYGIYNFKTPVSRVWYSSVHTYIRGVEVADFFLFFRLLAIT